MLRIPDEFKETIRMLVEADPEVALATCDIPHLDPSTYLHHNLDGGIPYCGCFVGVYAWMKTCKAGHGIDLAKSIPDAASGLGAHVGAVVRFASWCNTGPKDRAAVRYARNLLAG